MKRNRERLTKVTSVICKQHAFIKFKILYTLIYEMIIVYKLQVPTMIKAINNNKVIINLTLTLNKKCKYRVNNFKLSVYY